MAAEYVAELVTLPRAPGPDILERLLAVPGGAEVTALHGHDAAGHARVQLRVAHPDPEVVAVTRQAVLRACQAAGVAAFVV